MRKAKKFIAVLITTLIFVTSISTSAFAKDFAPSFDIQNPGIRTQYLYEQNDPSWLRKLVVKEDMLSAEGIVKESTLYPVTNYPYTTDAEHFKAQVEECIVLYTLDENSQRAAYLYLLETVGALSIISDPSASDKSKADWLREQGIIITEEEEKDPDKVLMISALYAMMKNDLYYVYTGKHITIPKGTPLEEAVVIYLSALSGQNTLLSQFISKFFGGNSPGTLEDYIYYTSLMALYTNGYVSAGEVTKISREEVYKRLAIMTIRNYGISVDSQKATPKEIQEKYLTAMLGTHYEVSLDPESVIKAKAKNTIPYYILQRMAYEDAKLTISQTKYTYKQCFEKVLLNTDRFDIENTFFADIHEYNVYLENNRSTISVSCTSLNSSSVITLNGTKVNSGTYAQINLKNIEHQILNIVSKNTSNGKTTTSKYILNIFQGVTPAPDSNLTGLIPTYGSTTTPNGGSNTGTSGNTGASVGNNAVTLDIGSLDLSGKMTLPNAGNIISGINGSASDFIGQILSLNDQGQLVDQYGNVVSPSTYETLPEGYQYVMTDDGIIQVVFLGETTTESILGTSSGNDTQQKRNTIIIISIICILGLIIALALTIIFAKKSKGKTKKDIERAKKQKKEARALKKEQNKKK